MCLKLVNGLPVGGRPDPWGSLWETTQDHPQNWTALFLQGISSPDWLISSTIMWKMSISKIEKDQEDAVGALTASVTNE